MDLTDLEETLRGASESGTPVEVLGGGVHRGRGGPVAAALFVRAPSGVVAHEPADLTCTVRGGTTLEELALVLGRSRQELPVSGIPQHATVGGVLAAGTSSRRRLRTGALRDRLLQVVFVTGDARVVKGGGPTVKNVSGYDLCRLLCGSLGTLGVIVEVILKVTPIPAASAWWICETGTVAESHELGTSILGALYDPAAVEVCGPPWRVQVHLEGHRDDVFAQAERLPAGFVECGAPLLAEEVLEAAIPPASLSRLLRDDRPARAQLGVGLAWFVEASEVLSIRAEAEAVGGRLHTLRPIDGVDPFGAEPAGAAIMRRLRRAFDPAGILNPRRIPFL